jgi:hypothetical protein
MSNTTIWWNRYVLFITQKSTTCFGTSLAIFRLIMRNLIRSYARFACVVYSGEVKGEVGTRSGMCCVGWVVGCSGTFCSRLIYGNIL